ncbi:ShlB/FhaC/HecB family hemolysin secretion/activation protein [Agaribacterium haliotis]|uniref:ShlB/FhaC/HecB family hemolysin secretion/activation protein n=1 Tax=Agaribacterium haliotis TaxID=2013869 RepID=UPI00130423F4|nr:ShlB/FhaC/HecB family hemolysin secretion/activation protein [Agaribacterium haliotis]
MRVICAFKWLLRAVLGGLILIGAGLAFANTSTSQSFRLTGITLSTSFESIGEHLDHKELNKVVRSERFKLGNKVRFSDLKRFSENVTNYMQDRGYAFHYAYFPEQDIGDGIVNVSIRSVSLGEVHIENHSRIDDQLFVAQFAGLVEQPVYQPDIDEVILRISSHEEIRAYAYYRQGKKPGTVNLHVNIEEVSRASLAVTADNYGSAETGAYRLQLQSQLLSPLKRFDRLAVGMMAAPNSGDTTTFGYLNYSLPINGLDNRLGFNLSNNIFSVGQDFSELELSGDALVMHLDYEHSYGRSLRGDKRFVLRYEKKATDFDSRFDDPAAKNAVEPDEATSSFVADWKWRHRLSTSYYHYTNLAFVYGNYSKTDTNKPNNVDGDTVDAAYQLIRASYFSSYTPARGKLSQWGSRINASVRAQFAPNGSSSFDQIALGGAYAVRSVKPGSFSADRGMVLSVEWHLPALLESRAELFSELSPYLYSDFSFGDQLNEDGSVFDSATFWGLGVGAIKKIRKNFSWKVELSQTLSASIDSGREVENMTFLSAVEYRWP